MKIYEFKRAPNPRRVQMFLAEANKASVEVSDELINEFGEACKEAFRKQFTA